LPKSNKLIALLILAIFLGLVLRVGAWNQKANTDRLQYSTDSVQYTALAKNLLAGNGYRGADHMLAKKGELTAFYAPAYPIFIAGLYAVFGQSEKVVLIAHVLLGLLSIYLVYLLGARLYSETAGVIAALIFGLIPQIVHYEFLLISETLFIFLVLIIAILMVDVLNDENSSLRQYVLIGLLLGVAYLCRQTVLILPLVFSVAVWFKRKDKGVAWVAKRLSIFAVLVLLVIMPWAVRNYVVFGEFMFGTTTAPATLWWGTYEETGKELGPLIDDYKRKHPDKGEVEMSHMMSAEAKTRLSSMNLSQLSTMMLHRLRRMFGYPAKHVNIRGVQTRTGVFYTFLYLGILGFFASARRHPERAMFAWFIVLTFSLHMATLAVFRYSMPMVPFLVIGLSYCLVKLFESMRALVMTKEAV
jgi:4-amino-4-deoxy-L-arabinose transferase-like glycosyltransferase